MDLRRAGVAGGGQAGDVGCGHEEVATGVAQLVHAQVVLGVHLGVERQRHAPEQVLHLGQVFVQELQVAADLAAE
ncbi:hypothetical protein D9M69_659910 [compost metagenome]